MKKTHIKLSMLSLCACMITSSAHAASQVVVPNNLNPGVLGNTVTESFEQTQYEKQNEYKPRTNPIRKPTKVLKSNVSTSERLVQNPEFTVNEFIIDGNSVINDKKLEEFTKELKGKKVKIAELLNLCNKITEYYHQKGYITSRAKLMPQKVEGGVVEITIDEGKYGDINIKGNKWAKTRHLKTILQANGVKENDVLNANELNNSINEINNKSYIQGKIAIDEGAEYDLKNITLEVEDRCPIDLNLSWDNGGQELTGRQRGIATLSHNNVTGYGDKLYGGAILGDGTTGAIGGYSIPIGKKGTRVNMGYSYSNMQYGGVYEKLGLEGISHDYSVGVTQPIHRGEKWTVDSAASLNLRDITTKIDNFGDLTDHRLTVLRTGISAKRQDSKGIWGSAVQVSTGLPLFNATEAPENLGYEDSKFVKFEANVQRLHVLPKKCLGLASLRGQYTPNKLLSAEKMTLGGSSLRGYDPAMVVGDMGLNGTLEVRTPVPFLKKVLPEKLKQYEEKVKLGAFYDYGLTRDMHGFNSRLSGKSTNFLQSAGVGIHFPLTKYLTANVDVGVPLGRGVFKDQDARLSFSVTSALHNMWAQKVKKPNL